MCLNRITKKVENPSLEEKTVYKIFELREGKLLFQYRSSQNGLIKTNEWITARAQIVRCARSADSYETGFHCYLSKTAALENCCDEYEEVVKKVLVREITYYGTQHATEKPCLVARQMYIPSDSEVEPSDDTKKYFKEIFSISRRKPTILKKDRKKRKQTVAAKALISKKLKSAWRRRKAQAKYETPERRINKKTKPPLPKSKVR